MRRVQEEEKLLPEDVIYSVFLLLPIKTLIRFRSLSKRWNNIIIRSPAFGKQHLLKQFENRRAIRSSTCKILFTHPFSSKGASYSYSATILNNTKALVESGDGEPLPPPEFTSTTSCTKYDQVKEKQFENGPISSNSNKNVSRHTLPSSCGASYLRLMNRMTDIGNRVIPSADASYGYYSKKPKTDIDSWIIPSEDGSYGYHRKILRTDTGKRPQAETEKPHRLPPPVKLNFPFQVVRYYEEQDPANYSWLYSSSCHGQLCISHYDPWTSAAFVYVWNPLTGQSRQIPWPVKITERSHVLLSYVGFGYDASIDDYKIVVHTYDSEVCANRTQVMSLKSTAWRSIDVSGWGICFSKPVAIDADLYWVSKKTCAADREDIISYIFEKDVPRSIAWMQLEESHEETSLILKFNLAEEKLTNMSLPLHQRGRPSFVRLGQYIDGSLCCYYYDNRLLGTTSAWTMNPRDGTWNQLLKIQNFSSFRAMQKLQPLGFTSNGDLIMATRNRYGLVVYLKGQKRFVSIALEEQAHPQPCSLDVEIHLLQMETLISPMAEERRGDPEEKARSEKISPVGVAIAGMKSCLPSYGVNEKNERHDRTPEVELHEEEEEVSAAELLAALKALDGPWRGDYDFESLI